MCPTQYLRIRDGDSLASELIAEYIGGTEEIARKVISAESQILLEFYSNELSMIGDSCKGGFLIHAMQLRKSARRPSSLRICNRFLFYSRISSKFDDYCDE